MTRKEAKVLLPIIKAYAEGKTIECRTRVWELNKGWKYSTTWKETEELKFQDTYEYRIKPKSTYRPFKDAEECWSEMQKHQPFGWIKDRDGDKTFIGSINSDNSIFTCSSEILFLKEIFEDFTFIDGIPFGIKEK